MGVAIGSSVGALLAADLAGVGLSGLAQSAAVIGGALAAIPATAIVHRHGRRPSLAAAYGVAAVGALLVVLAAVRGSLPLLFLGFLLFGGATAANLQARYAAVDLAPAALRGRHLSLIVWATTIGAVAGPHLAAPARGPCAAVLRRGHQRAHRGHVRLCASHRLVDRSLRPPAPDLRRDCVARDRVRARGRRRLRQRTPRCGTVCGGTRLVVHHGSG